ncbi:diaminopimelate epimerase [bacterium]|nr:diaminopimelate epimerase [bacterium]
MRIHFFKMQGCGNDFLFLDSIQGIPPRFRPTEIQYYCDRHFGIGADGIVVLHRSENADVAWTFYNSDGSIAEMCGNAARCAIRYVSERYLPDETVSLETHNGVVKGRKLESDQVEVALLPQQPFDFEYTEHILEIDKNVFQVYCTNTGVPHAVLEVKDLMTYPIARIGKLVQGHALFAKHGTNVTFFQRLVANRIRSTTFERGVEAETLACGTGAAAAALVFSRIYAQPLPVNVSVPGGDLVVDLSPVSRVLLLQGPAKYVYDIEVDSAPSIFERVTVFGQAQPPEASA